MKKVRQRIKVERGPKRASRAQVFRIKPDPAQPHVVEVYFSPSKRHMYATADFKKCETEHDYNGMVSSYASRVTGHSVVKPRQVIARMFLNNHSIRENGAEILCHEAVHAGMAWARLRKSDLSKIAGEEVMAYATGRMHLQLVTIANMRKVWA